MKTTLITVLALTISLPLSASAFDNLPPGKWWENPHLVERIELGEEQREMIKGMVYEHVRRMIDLSADVERAELDLADRVDQSDFDADTVRAAFVAFQKARQRLESERFEMLLSVRQVLSIEQWRELQKLRREFERRRPDHPRGNRRPGQMKPPAGERPVGGNGL
jgi:Spy/CpxP family protein refolding chaperone